MTLPLDSPTPAAGQAASPAGVGAPLVVTVFGTPAPQGSHKAFVRGNRAIVTNDSAKTRPWRQAVLHAALAALPDRDLDRWFPRRGVCQVCGTDDQRHRVVDAIAELVLAGDDEEDVANDFGVTLDHVRAAVASHKWPIVGPAALRMVFTLPKPKSAPKRTRILPAKRPDWDKLARSTGDALTDAGVYRDDAQVIDASVRKVFPGEDPEALHVPGAVITVWPVIA